MNLQNLVKIEKVIKTHINTLREVMIGKKVNESLPGVSQEQVGLIALFFKYGKQDTLASVSIKNKTIDQINKILQLPLSNKEINVILWIYLQVQSNLDFLEDKIITQVVQLIANYELQREFSNETFNAYNLAQEIQAIVGGELSKWKALCHTELWNANLYGQAIAIIESEDTGMDTYVYKVVEETACKYCKKHYLDESGVPKVFKLRDLIANGSNDNKPARDWKPVLGTMHTNCMCILKVPKKGDEVPENHIQKSDKLTDRTVDKSKLTYVKKIVVTNGVTHEQGFWVKNNDTNNKITKQDDDGNLKQQKKPQNAAGSDNTENLGGMNQTSGVTKTIPNSDVSAVQYGKNKFSNETPTIIYAKLPDKRKNKIAAVIGFDFGTMLSIKAIFGRKKAIKYAKDSGFDLSLDDTDNNWENTLAKVSEFTMIQGTPNQEQDYTQKINEFVAANKAEIITNLNDELQSYSQFSRAIYELSGGLTPVVGAYNIVTDKIDSCCPFVNNSFLDLNGKELTQNQWLVTLKGTIEDYAIVPLTLKKSIEDASKGEWTYNGLDFIKSDISDTKMKKMLDSIIELLLEGGQEHEQK